jgi:general secretion pathway protein D
MEIKQTVKQIGSAISDTAAQLSAISRQVDERAIETNMVVKDGDTAVLGGLMKNSEKVDVTKVPLLGDIPVLGWLFKSQTTTVEKNNLIVFITPKVIRNPEDSNQLLTNKLDERIRFVKENENGVDKFGATAENLRPKLKRSAKPAIDEDDTSNTDDGSNTNSNSNDDSEDEFIEQ